MKECPECKALFQIPSSKFRLSREFKDHLGICGLGGEDQSKIKQILSSVSVRNKKFHMDPPSGYGVILEQFHSSESDEDSIARIEQEMFEPEVLVGFKEEMCEPAVTVGINEEEFCMRIKEEICELEVVEDMELICKPKVKIERTR